MRSGGIYVGHTEMTVLSEICNIRICVHLENNTGVENGTENFGRLTRLIFVVVRDAGH